LIDATGELLAIGLFVGVCAALLTGFPVAFTLAGTSLLFAGLGNLLGHFDFVFFLGLAPRYFGIMLSETLVAVPLFIFMGFVLERSGIAEELLRTAGALFGARPGGLGYAVVVVGAVLAASTGVVGAVVVTMSLISLPTMLKAGYDPRLATGVIGGSATLAQLIPPSTVLILVADMLQGVNQTAQLALGNLAPEPVSVGDLFAGAFLPGLLLVLLFLLWIAYRAWRQPEMCPPLVMDAEERRDLNRHVLTALVFPMLLIVSVLGSILAGIATATESASIGAVGALLFAALRRRLDLATLYQACLRTAFTSAMIFVILFAASVFSLVFRGLGGEALVEEALRAMPGGAIGAMAVFMALVFVLGFFLDTFEIIFITLPIFGPPLLMMGLDPVWLGVMMALNLQTSFLTPPFGATLFYQRSATPASVSTADIWRGSITPTCLQVAALVLVWLFPAVATWLPGVLLRG
jgi:tripartite ATP-independent transporter DctM subunit